MRVIAAILLGGLLSSGCTIPIAVVYGFSIAADSLTIAHETVPCIEIVKGPTDLSWEANPDCMPTVKSIGTHLGITQ